MKNLSRALGGPRLWIKRDDCAGLLTGGNKTRKLEFLMAEALARKADVVVTRGRHPIDHARQTAAAAARLRRRCHILLEDRTGSTDPGWESEMNDKRLGDIAARLAQSAANNPVREFEKNSRALLGTAFAKLDLVRREGFDVQSEVLARAPGPGAGGRDRGARGRARVEARASAPAGVMARLPSCGGRTPGSGCR